MGLLRKFRSAVEGEISRAGFRYADFDYEGEVAQVRKDFPGTKDKVLFFDIDNWRVINPGERKIVTQLMYGVVLQSLKRGIEKDFAKMKRRSPVTFIDDVNGKRYVGLLTAAPEDFCLHSSASATQKKALVFDHEVAHAVIPGDGFENKDECIADAYSVIRHLQRYGANSPVIEALVRTRAFHLVFREQGYGRAHFTTPVVEKILEQRNTVDWSRLTSQQTTEMACKFASDYAFSLLELNKIDEEFKAFHDKARAIESGDTAPVKALAEKLRATDSAVVFKYGMLGLQAVQEMKNIGPGLKGEAWDEVCRRLAIKQQTFVQPTQRIQVMTFRNRKRQSL